MKKLIALLLACMMVLGLAACGAAEPATTTAAAGNETQAPAGDDTAAPEAEAITLTVWGPQAELGENNDGWLPQLCEAFDEAHPEWEIEFKYEVCGEGDAGTKVTQDPTVAGDIYFFANDHHASQQQRNDLFHFVFLLKKC